MYPELFNIFGLAIQTYGFCLMIGFLTAVWFAMRRAARVKADPDVVLDVSFLALIFGVAGARLFYVVHYWQSQFADSPNPIWAAIDIRKGGLEFLGGLSGAIAAIFVYLWRKKQPVRMYLDILTPGAMWGLGVGRIGCFFNGCCFGAVCVVPGTDIPKYPWAIRFPYGSGAQIHQWQDRLVTMPAELIVTAPGILEPSYVPSADLDLPVEKREGARRDYENARDIYEKAAAQSPNAPDNAALKKQMEAKKKAAEDQIGTLKVLLAAQSYPSRIAPERASSVTELQDLAAQRPSLPVHPVQLYSSASALLLSGFLSNLFYRRKRHGVIFGLMCVLYPISRVFEEMIRTDNPHDTAGLTVSQFISIGMFALGAAYLYVLYNRMPERASPEPAPCLPKSLS